MTYQWKVSDPVIYKGKTYSFVGEICGLTDDGQVIVRATIGPYAGMKHIYGPHQVWPFDPSAIIYTAAHALCRDKYPCQSCLDAAKAVLDAIKEIK